MILWQTRTYHLPVYGWQMRQTTASDYCCVWHSLCDVNLGLGSTPVAEFILFRIVCDKYKSAINPTCGTKCLVYVRLLTPDVVPSLPPASHWPMLISATVHNKPHISYLFISEVVPCRRLFRVEIPCPGPWSLIKSRHKANQNIHVDFWDHIIITCPDPINIKYQISYSITAPHFSWYFHHIKDWTASSHNSQM